jgi:3'(2'), 5'-bisphosphate nucleotidase
MTPPAVARPDPYATAALVDEVRELAERAAEEILAVYARPLSSVAKADDSPLTEADLRAHRIICDGLAKLTPSWPVLSEESAAIDYAVRATWDAYWLVDPLDGTREFLSRNGEFTVNIALIRAHRAVLGVVQIPVSGETYGGIPGRGAWRAPRGLPFADIRVSASCADPVRVLGSRSHRGDSLEGFLTRLGAYEMVGVGSSLKFCRLAEGLADVYPRLGPTSEWDTAAGQAILEAAGGVVVTLDGKPMRYNTKSELLNPHFLACAGEAQRWFAYLAP